LKILVVDTSGKEIGIGIFEGYKCLYEKYVTADRLYNRYIMPLVAEATLKAGLRLEEIDTFAAALGPGSFTGIRVGMAVMKAFAHGLNRRFYGVSTLDILAKAANGRGRTWAVVEAGRGEVFAAEYKKSGILSPESGIKRKYLLLSRESFFKRLKKRDMVAGIAGENIMVELKANNSKIDIAELEHVDLKSFAGLIGRKNDSGNRAIYEIAPVYIRLSEAEARRRNIKKKTGGKSK
jgi:tRNA threonylcarbamoyladenosine biosynthesis protein TsaB